MGDRGRRWHDLIRSTRKVARIMISPAVPPINDWLPLSTVYYTLANFLTDFVKDVLNDTMLVTGIWSG